MSQWNYTAPADPQRYTTLPPNTYDAELVSYEFTTSKKGNPMVALKLKVYGDNSEHTISDWLVDLESMAWKTKAFVEAVGQTYGLPIDFDKVTGKLFQVKIIEDSYTNDKGEKVTQNKVNDYYPAAKNSARPVAPVRTVSEVGSDIKDSDLPF